MLRQLFRFAAKHQSLQLSVYCGRAWARLSCNLQSSVSQCFLNRAGSVAAIEKDIDFVDLTFDWGKGNRIGVSIRLFCSLRRLSLFLSF